MEPKTSKAPSIFFFATKALLQYCLDTKDSNKLFYYNMPPYHSGKER